MTSKARDDGDEMIGKESSPDGGLASIASITVTFNPDVDILRLQLQNLPGEVLKVVVDNASSPTVIHEIRRVVRSFENSVLVENESNVGLPAAINIGVRHVSKTTTDRVFFLFLDQDSEPVGDSVVVLHDAYLELERDGLNPGCVGPRLIDATTGLEHGFHHRRGAHRGRVRPARCSSTPVSCSTLNCSGTFTSKSLYEKLGGYEDAFFMDHLDTEWSFRVSAAGYGLYGIPGALFMHRMGERSLKFWLLGWKIWPYRSPGRHYYLFRNATLLIRRGYVPRNWKFLAVVKLVATMLVHAAFDAERTEQLHQMARGIRAGAGDPL